MSKSRSVFFFVLCIMHSLLILSALRIHQQVVKADPEINPACRTSINHFKINITEKSDAKWYPNSFTECVDKKNLRNVMRNRRVLIIGNSILRAQYFDLLYYLHQENGKKFSSAELASHEAECYKEDISHLMNESKISCYYFVTMMNTSVFFRFEGDAHMAAKSVAFFHENRYADHQTGQVFVGEIDSIIFQIGVNHLLRPGKQYTPKKSEEYLENHEASQGTFETAYNELAAATPILFKAMEKMVGASSAAASGKARIIYKTSTPVIPVLFGGRTYWDCSAARNDFISDLNSLMVKLAPKNQYVRMVDDFNTVWTLRKGDEQTSDAMGYADFIHPADVLRRILVLETLCALEESGT